MHWARSDAHAHAQGRTNTHMHMNTRTRAPTWRPRPVVQEQDAQQLDGVEKVVKMEVQRGGHQGGAHHLVAVVVWRSPEDCTWRGSERGVSRGMGLQRRRTRGSGHTVHSAMHTTGTSHLAAAASAMHSRPHSRSSAAGPCPGW